MKKRELKDVNVLFNEYDEMMFKLQRDDINLLRNVVFSVMSSFMLSLLISWIIYSSIHFEIVILMLVTLSFIIVFIVYNCSSIKGLNEILKQIKEENNLNYRISVVKNSLNDIGFDFKENKIPKRKLLYFINYWKINEIFCYKIYLKYEIKNKKNLLKKIEELREKKQENKNITIQILEKIKLLSILVITTLLYKHLPSIFEKLNNGDISFMNVVYYIQIIIFVILMLALLIYFIMYIINSLKLNEKKLQIEKLKFIENCIYYLDNSEKIEITETINKLKKQEEMVFEIKELQVESDNTKILKKLQELQVEINENFGEIPRTYLKKYQDIFSNKEISNEEKQNKLSELLISMETEKDFYRENKIIKISNNKEKIYREVSKIPNVIISEKLQTEIEKNFGEISKKYLKEYQDIFSNKEISNEEKQNKLSELLISMETEKNLYKIEKVTKILTRIEKQEEMVFKIKKLQAESNNSKIFKKLQELQAEIEKNFGKIPRTYLKEYQGIYNNQKITNKEKQKKLSNKLSELSISMETEKNFYKESKIIRNSENEEIKFFEMIKNFLRKGFIKGIIKIFKIITYFLAIIGGYRLYETKIKPLFENKEIEYILYNQTEEKEITIKANLEKIKVSKQKPKSIKLKKGKDRIERILDKKCEIPSDEIKAKNKVEIEFKNDGSCSLKK